MAARPHIIRFQYVMRLSKMTLKVSQNQFSFFLLIVYTIHKATFTTDSIEMQSIGSKDISVEGLQNNRRSKVIICFVWVYFTISILFRFMLLDHITYTNPTENLHHSIRMLHRHCTCTRLVRGNNPSQYSSHHLTSTSPPPNILQI